MKIKSLPAQIDVTNEAKREVVAIVSSTAVDRDSEIVLPKGMGLDNYRKNPIVLFNHDPGLPIAKTLWIKSDGKRILAKYRLGETDFAKDIFTLLKDGILNAHSIGFRIDEDGPPSQLELQDNPEWKGCRNVIRKGELLEYSVVSIPSNPEAMTLAVKSVSADTLQLLGKAWLPKPDCWKWVDPAPVVETKQEIPMPKFARPWKEKEADIMQRVLSQITTEEIIHRLKGRA